MQKQNFVYLAQNFTKIDFFFHTNLQQQFFQRGDIFLAKIFPQVCSSPPTLARMPSRFWEMSARLDKARLDDNLALGFGLIRLD
jgi:hypothetical protein